jgi:hypothetical protein
MNNKFSVFMLVGILAFAGFAPLSKIFINEPLTNGQENEIIVVVNNDLNRDFDDTRVRIFVYDLGMFFHSSGFDMESNSNSVSRFYWTPDNVPAGDYLAKVEISNDKFRSWRHVWLPVR